MRLIPNFEGSNRGRTNQQTEWKTNLLRYAQNEEQAMWPLKKQLINP